MYKVYNNTTECPNCKRKMYYSRKKRLHFHWVGLIDKDNEPNTI